MFVVHEIINQMTSKFFWIIAFMLLLSACGSDADFSATTDDLTHLGVAEAARKIQAGEITSVQLVEALIEKIEASVSLNAWITFDASRAQALAREADQRRTGRLRGVPLIVKDNIEVAGMRHTAGTPSLLRYVPGSSAPVVAALVAEGAIIIGKANMHELAFGITSNNGHFGPVRNPRQPAYFAGGSSGGNAAAIAAGMVPAGLGSDTGGSVRIPAALTGIHGFRPTTGRYSVVGLTPISTTKDTVGIMARQIEDIILLDSVISGRKADFTAVAPSAIRLGVPRDFFYDNLQPEVRAVLDRALQKLRSAGVTLIPMSVTADLKKLSDAVGLPVALYEVRPGLVDYLRERTKGYIGYDELVAAIASPDVAETFAQAVGAITPAAYDHALNIARPALQKLYAHLFAANDLDGIVVPTTLLTARPIIGSDQKVRLNAAEVNTFLTYIHNTEPSSNAGLPSISIDAGDAGVLPVGMQIDAPAGNDAKLLRIALTVAQVLSQ